MDAAKDPMQLDALLELQIVEQELRRARKELAALPEQERLDAAVAEKESMQRQRDDLALERTDVTSRATTAERQVGQLRVRLGKERERLYSGGVTNAREEKSVQAEIKAVLERIDDGETTALELLEQQEELDGRIGALDAGLEEQDGSIAHLTTRRDEAAAKLETVIAEHRADGMRRRGELDAELLAEYDAVSRNRPGRAVGKLVGSKCTSCQMDLPTSQASQLRAHAPLGTCPSCGSMIIVGTSPAKTPTDPTAV